TQAVAERIFTIIGRPDMIDDPRFRSNSDRIRHRDLVDAAIGGWFAARPSAEALSIMREAGATVGPIYSIAEAYEDAHFREREVLVDVEDADFGSLPMHNIVPRLSQTPGGFFRPAPDLGADGEAILAEVGLDPDRIAIALDLST